MKNQPKYLVRPDDFCIFEIDDSNGCYRTYGSRGYGKNRPNAYKHFSFENLTENYSFFPIEESELEFYDKKHSEQIEFMSWQCRNDGHGEAKGGTWEEFLEYKERVRRFNEKYPNWREEQNNRK